MLSWIVETFKQELDAAYCLILGSILLFSIFAIGDFFGGIGDKLFGKKGD